MNNPNKWDEQYRKGVWEYLKAPEQAARYGVIAAWIAGSCAGCQILDVGCGEGNLLKYLLFENFEHYTGIDFSEQAISQAQKLWAGYQKIDFRVEDIQKKIGGNYDDCNVIIFNEILYCFENPIKILHEYLNHSRIIIYSVTTMHSDTSKLIERVFKDNFEQLVVCEDSLKSKGWAIGMLRSRS